MAAGGVRVPVCVRHWCMLICLAVHVHACTHEDGPFHTHTRTQAHTHTRTHQTLVVWNRSPCRALTWPRPRPAGAARPARRVCSILRYRDRNHRDHRGCAYFLCHTHTHAHTHTPTHYNRHVRGGRIKPRQAQVLMLVLQSYTTHKHTRAHTRCRKHLSSP